VRLQGSGWLLECESYVAQSLNEENLISLFFNDRYRTNDSFSANLVEKKFN
jgi:hypothetical protein